MTALIELFIPAEKRQQPGAPVELFIPAEKRQQPERSHDRTIQFIFCSLLHSIWALCSQQISSECVEW